MGVQKDVADYFRRSFDESGVLQKVVMFVNLANDPGDRAHPDPPLRSDRRRILGL